MNGYEPLNTLKSVAEGIWIVDGPRIHFYGVPFTTRMTVVQLENGDIWLHSPTRPTADLQAQIEALGPVRHLVAPNWIHYAYIAEWQEAYPNARAWCAPGVVERARKHGMALHFDAALSDTPPPAWAGQIDQLIVKGSTTHREAVFFHRASKTLILTDLIENVPARLLSIWIRPLAWLGGILAPNGSMPRDMRHTFHDRAALRVSLRRMIGWAPTRIILAHGDWFRSDGTGELKRAFGWAFAGDVKRG